MVSKEKSSFLGLGGESALFLRLKKYKDKQAFIEAYDLYIDQIFRFIYFKVGSREEAEDLSSVVFLKCWNYIYEGNLQEDKSLKALLYKIARNTIIDHYRQQKNRATVSLENVEAMAIPADTQDPIEEVATTIDFEKVIVEKLPQLKEEYREVIILRFMNELSISEIAGVLGKTNGNIRVMIHRALASLQQLVKDESDEEETEEKE